MTAYQHKKMLACEQSGKNYKLTVNCPGGEKVAKAPKVPKAAIQKVKKVPKQKELKENVFVRRMKEVLKFYNHFNKKQVSALKTGEDALGLYIEMRESQGMGLDHAAEMAYRDVLDTARIPTKVSYYKKK